MLMIREEFSHMQAVSGFDPLCKAIEELESASTSIRVDSNSIASYYNSFRTKSFHQRLIAKLRRDQNPELQQRSSPSPFITNVHEEIGTIVLAKVRGDDSSIFLSIGENQYGSRLLSAPKDIRQRLILCLHQPPSWHRLHWRDPGAFQGVRAIVCLSQELRHYLLQHTTSPVFAIRHGVLLDFFQPPLNLPENLSHRILFVGQWLRDFETLEKAFAIIHHRDPTITLDCVVPHFARDTINLTRLARNENVTWHARISPEELRKLYQQASLLFLPLLDATANNAIVEALACGLPIISSSVGGIPEYVNACVGELCPPGDADAHASAVLRWLGWSERLILARREARSFAETELSWSKIASELLAQLNILQ